MARPEIPNAASQVARQRNYPALSHLKATLKVLQYLRGTRDLGVSFSSRQGNEDASLGEKDKYHRSLSGGIFLVLQDSWMYESLNI